MCFASSIVEAHKKLFIAPAVAEANRRSGIGGESKGGGMSRSSKTRLQVEVCGDCGASDPAWASINRGILLCSDCCSVHRSLGRHISMVKSLRQGTWEPSVLNLVNSLNAHGANSVWEHHLLDGTTQAGAKNAPRLRKPTPKDALHPTKSDFIKAKHINLAFVLKPNLQEDDDICSGGASIEQELCKQLHASVRTSNLETSLRLLVQGADPNFFHEEKRSTPLHVAAKFGQASQIELLIVYGANLSAIDGSGLTPLEVARANNHNTIAERLTDALYDVTDRIITFLGGKKPDHASGRHLIIPDGNLPDISEELKIARGRLQLVPNKMFEELVMDLYDEIDRRENEAIWATSTLNAEIAAVPFLPANPFLSATRNQGRQKLARFSRSEFAGLLTDVLIDARRRQNMATLRPMDANSSFCNITANTTKPTTNFNTSDHDSNLSDDEPIYDPVASDDDYAPVASITQQAIVHHTADGLPARATSSYEVQSLRQQINNYVSEINQLKTVVQKLSSENSELKYKFTQLPQTAAPSTAASAAASTSNSSIYDEPLRIDLNGSEEHDHEPHSLPAVLTAAAGGSNSSSASSSAPNSNQSTIKRPVSMYERRLAKNAASKVQNDSRATASMYQVPAGPAERKPFSSELKQRTDILTRRLKELIMAMQDGTGGNGKQHIVHSSESICVAVMELIAVFTSPASCSDTIRETLKQLTRNNILIQHECENLQNAYNSADKENIEKYVKEVRDCAYYIASAIKTLVMQYD